jgi:hypothetical protein
MCVAERAVDGDTTAATSRWLSTPDAPTHWLVVDLEQVCAARDRAPSSRGRTRQKAKRRSDSTLSAAALHSKFLISLAEPDFKC